MLRSMIRRSAYVALLVPSLAAAQAGDAARTSLLGITDASLLHPGRWTYDTRIVAPGTPPHRISLRTVSVTASTYAGAPAWLMVDARQTRGVMVVESLYVDRRTLAPGRRIAHTSDTDIDVRFTPDSITSSVTSGAAVEHVTRANEPALLAALFEAEVLTQLLPLAAGWRGTGKLLTVGPHEMGTVPLQMRVMGEEPAAIPGGSFDCWVVALTVGSGGERLWVRKSDRAVIRATAPILGMPDASIELILASSKE